MKPRIRISLREVFLVITLLAVALGFYTVVRSRAGARSPNQSLAAAPLATGVLERVTVWQRPVQRPGETGGNSGNSPPAGSYVEVYEHFILITPPAGPTILSPHGWYTDLTFKRDIAPASR